MVRQTQYQSCYIRAAVNPVNGDVSQMITPTVNTDYMNAHLRFIGQLIRPDEHAVVILDRAGWHVSKALVIPSNVSLLHLPSYSPELNPVERVWSYLRSHYLSNRVYGDYDAIFDACTAATNRLTPEQLKSITRTRWLERTD
jgi:transposase